MEPSAVIVVLCREAVPPTVPLFSKTLSKQLFDQPVKYLAVTNKLTSYNIPSTWDQTFIPLPGVLIYHTAEKLESVQPHYSTLSPVITIISKVLLQYGATDVEDSSGTCVQD